MKSQSLAARLALTAGALLLAGTAHANLVANSGFETNSFAGWTYVPGSNAFDGTDTGIAHSGTYGAFFGNIGTPASQLFQTLATTAGATYVVDFWLSNLSATAPNSFSFNWNGGAAEQTLTNAAAFGYTKYTFSLTATSATTDLRFSFRHDPSFWVFDDVSVVQAVPEPASLALVIAALTAAGFAGRRGNRAS